jgi:acetamidase/formamidase
MRKYLVLLFFVPGLLLAEDSVSGRWIVTADAFRTPIYLSLELKQEGNKLSGMIFGEKLSGTVQGSSVRFVAKSDDGGSFEYNGALEGGTMSGTVVSISADEVVPPSTYRFTAKRVAQRRAGAPQHHEFTPTVFYREFSATNPPVLTVAPGDSVHTTTVDAGGLDEKGIERVLGGNPQTGPFYIETAGPGDMLVVHIDRLRLNRDWAQSDDALVDRALDTGLAVQMKGVGKAVRWHLDAERGIATPAKPTEHLAKYSVPLRPMLGCVAVASTSVRVAANTGDSGRYGGNMDFNELVEGATLYLPVNVPGALLYLGDAHAAQGDGELNGNALETSMDVEFTVDVVPAKNIPGPRLVSATHIMAMGLSGSLDDAFRVATANMAQWLADDYKLTPSEVARVLGTSAEYKVSEVADRNAGIVLKINKERLAGLAAEQRKAP